MRRVTRFHGSDAFYDSNTATSYMPYSHLYSRSAFSGALTIAREGAPSDIELLHESVHWLQHVGSGYGAFVNELRRHRDHQLLKALAFGDISFERIRARIDGSESDPLLPFLDIDRTVERILQPRPLPITIASALYWAEELITDRTHAAWSPRERIIVFYSAKVASGAGYSLMESDRRALEGFLKAKHYVAQESGRTISTIILQESAASALELYALISGGYREEFGRRWQALLRSDYMDALAYVFDALDANPEDPAALRSTLLTSAIAIECALDIYAPPMTDTMNIGPLDVYPPGRYAAIVSKLGRHSAFRVTGPTSAEELGHYRATICKAAGIRRSCDGNRARPPNNLNLLTKLFIGGNQRQQVFAPMGVILPDFYDMVAFMQHRISEEQRRTRQFHSTDIIESLSSRMRIPHRSDRASDFASLYEPLVLIYENGKPGLQEGMCAFASELLMESIKKYPVFALAHEPGPLVLFPAPLDHEILPADYASVLMEHVERLKRIEASID